MRQLGEQWIVEIDGVRHMVKLCESNYKEIGTCGGCIYHSWDECDWCDVAPLKACVEFGYIVKDLGPVNKDGLLACPFCKNFPKGISKGTEYKNDCEISIFYIEHSCNVIQSSGFCYTEQECIDAWNRRN